MEFPKEYLEAFDFVQIRYLVAALFAEDDWKAVAQNIKTLLKPGGTSQWIEADAFPCVMVLRGSNHTTSTAALRKGFKFVRSLPRIHTISNYFISERLAAILTECGYQSVEEDTVSSDRLPEYRKTTTLDHMKVMQVLATKFELRNSPTAADFEETKKEVGNGVYMKMELQAFTATA